MAERQSMVQELLECLQTRKHILNYLSPLDAVSVLNYSRSDFASRYVLDTVNLYWPGRVNRTQILGAPIIETVPQHPHSHPDAMDSICTNVVYNDAMKYILDCSLVHEIISDNLVCDAMSVLVETEKSYVLVKPDIEAQLRHCTVNLTRMDTVLSYVPKKDLCSVLLGQNRPHTRSQCTPKPVPTRRRPRGAHNTKPYCESDLTSDDEPKRK